MSRSSPPPSPTAGKDPDPVDNPGATAAGPGVNSRTSPTRGPSLARRFHLRLAAVMRWTHIYLSMFSMAALLFFSATGITLNHPSWFFGAREHSVQAEGHMK